MKEPFSFYAEQIIDLFQIPGTPSASDDEVASIKLGAGKERVRLDLSYVLGPGGSLRWVFPTRSRRPVLLALYHPISIKEKLYGLLLTLALRLGLLFLFRSGRIYISFSEAPGLVELLKRIPHEEWALCPNAMGLPPRGAGPKSRLALWQDGKVRTVLKVVHEDWPSLEAKFEERVLQKLAKGSFQYLRIPKPQLVDYPASLALSGITPPPLYALQTRGVSELGPLHFGALEELWNFDLSYEPVAPSGFDTNVQLCYQLIEAYEYYDEYGDISAEQVYTILYRIGEMYFALHEVETMTWVLAYGDFTPWNMYLSAGQVHLYHWEHFHLKAPIFFDLFHFIYQSEVLIHGQRYPGVKAKIQKILQTPFVQRIISRHQLDPWTQELMYVTYVSLLHIKKYITDRRVAPQAHWLMETWYEALEDLRKRRAAGEGAPRRLSSH